MKVEIELWSSDGDGGWKSNDAPDKVWEEGEVKQVCGEEEEGEEANLSNQMSHLQIKRSAAMHYVYFVQLVALY